MNGWRGRRESGCQSRKASEEIMLDRHLNKAQSELQSELNLGLNYIIVTDSLLEFSELVSSPVKM